MEQMQQMKHIGRVLQEENGMVTVRFIRSKMCEGCGACIHFGEKEADVSLKNTLGAQVGDYVRVELKIKSFLQASLLAYLLPVLFLIGGVAFGSRWSEEWAAALGLVGATAVFFLLRALDPLFAKSAKFNPHMVELIPAYEVEIAQEAESTDIYCDQNKECNKRSE